MLEMTFVDRVQETTITEGTGNIVPSGAIAGYRTFAAALNTGDSFYYLLSGEPTNPDQFEIGIGTLTSGGHVARAPIVSSSGSSAIDLPTGTKTIAVTLASQFLTTVQASDVFAAWRTLPGNETASVQDFIDAMLNVDGVRLRAPELVGVNLGKTIILVDPPIGLINSNGGNDGVNIVFGMAGGQFTQGPASQPNYWDTVLGIGFNINPDAFPTPLNPGMPSGSFRIESKFAQGGANSVFGGEYHISQFAKTAPFDELRAFSSFVPHEQANWATESSTGIRGAQIALIDGVGAPRFFLNGPGSYIDLNAGGAGTFAPVIRGNTNNRPVFSQLNAAGTSYLPGPYRNALNNHYFGSGAIYLVGPTQMTPTGNVSAFVVNVTEASANNSLMTLSGPAGNFNLFAQQLVGNNTGLFIQQIYAPSGSGVYEIQTLAGPSNDALLCFSNASGGTSWTIGYDNSDGDKLKIESTYRATGNVANLFVEFDTAAGVSAFAKPPKLPNRTIALLPNATTVGAGAMAYCTNESGGAVPVFSDGTNWRRVTDRAVVTT